MVSLSLHLSQVFCLLLSITPLWAQDTLKESAVLHGCQGPHPTTWQEPILQLLGFPSLQTLDQCASPKLVVRKLTQHLHSHCPLTQPMADGRPHGIAPGCARLLDGVE